ncbi:MAG: hypothetical protein Kilf2KO_49260 [Rhodospirillales bacterium]
MKRLLLSTVLTTALAVPFAAQAESPAVIFMPTKTDSSVMVSEFVGSRVYVSDAQADKTEIDGVDENWDDVGEVSDVILTRDGKVEAVIVDVGGFLGIGEKPVAASMSDLKLVSDGDETYFVVLKTSRAALQSAPEFEADEPAEKTAETKAQMTHAHATAPTITRDGYVDAPRKDLTAEMLTGADVYDTKDEEVGEVSKLLLSSDGQITNAVVDVGGFLGMGEKPVSVSLDSMTIQRQVDGDELRVYIDMTKEQLEAMPTYEG